MAKQFLWLFVAVSLGGCVYAPSRVGLPPGHGGVPPGHGGIPPGQAKKMGPPAVVVVGAPRLVVVPGTNVRVVLGVDADIFAVDHIYYYCYDGVWYKGHHYRGPWRVIRDRDLPHGLRGKSPKKLKAKIKGHKGRGRGKGRWDT